jgi:S-adenosylmethionine decarboxylase
MIGLHLIIDGESKEKITENTVTTILNELPDIIEMDILDGPHIVEGVPGNPGWTGFVIIDKSHISIHTFEKTSLLSIDVFSCKPFNTEKTVKYLKNMISFTKINTRTINRELLP